MNLKYIYHSGFLLELDTAYMLFDYYKGDIPRLDKDKNCMSLLVMDMVTTSMKMFLTFLGTIRMLSIYFLMT